jgi:hypothetical protein
MSTLKILYEKLIEALAELGRSKASRNGKVFNLEDQKKKISAALLPGILFVIGNATGNLYHPFYYIPLFLLSLYQINNYFGYIRIK